jgi:methionine-rich copper-binding protein CopC
VVVPGIVSVRRVPSPMPPEQRPSCRRWHRTVNAALSLTAAAAVVLSPGTARADGALVSADPPAGFALADAPQAVSLRFTAPIAVDSSHITVSTETGGDLADGQVQQTHRDRIGLPIRSAGVGDLTVAYHVTFADGTSATGAYRFSVGTGVPPTPLDSAARATATASVSPHAHGIDGISAVVLVLDGAVVLAVLFLLRVRRRDGQPMTLRAKPSQD